MNDEFEAGGATDYRPCKQGKGLAQVSATATGLCRFLMLTGLWRYLLFSTMVGA